MGTYYNPRIVTDGLVLALDAGNAKSYPGSGTTWTDLSSKKNNGTMQGGLIPPTFDGTNDTVDCGPMPEIGASLTGLTVCAWVNPSSQSTRMILENGSSYLLNTFYMTQENSNYFTFEVSDGATYDVRYADFVYALNTWYNLVGTWVSGERVKFYSNGRLMTSGETGGQVQTVLRNGDTNLFVGSRAGVSFQYSGSIPQVNIYNRALTAAEIKQNFNATRGRYGI
jgi:hypothetical protein